MKILCTLISTILSFHTFAGVLALGPYQRVQEALADDNYKLALSAHKDLCDKELVHLKGKYKDCSKTFKDIESLRNSFKSLSEIYIMNGNKKELAGLTKATCPMANGKWIQKNGDLRNPYYGKSMLECGEKLK